MKATTEIKEGFEHEKEFWAEFVQTERFQNNWVKAETNPELDATTRRVILAEANGTPLVLDIGSGPVSILRGLIPDLVAVDPLGDYYREIYPQCAVITAYAEDLPFTGNFDVVHIRNAFDHTQNPRKALESMAGACKPGGLIFIQGFVNEADFEQFAGLHQWNVSVNGNTLIVKGNGKGLQFSPDEVVLSETIELPTEKEWFYFAYRKPKA